MGIFGTQYRELISRPRSTAAIDRLDTVVCAPTKTTHDVRPRPAATPRHLGDWLIDQFPRSTERTLDRAAADRRRDRFRRSRLIALSRRSSAASRSILARLHPPLCALTSAHYAAYAGAGVPAACRASFPQLGSMLIDVFGRAYPEREFFSGRS